MSFSAYSAAIHCIPLLLLQGNCLQTPYFDILVPTVDTVRYGFLMHRLLSVRHSVLFTGTTGVGKVMNATLTHSRDDATLTHSLARSLTHPPTHSSAHSFTHSLTHPLTHSSTHPPTHPPTHSLSVSLSVCHS